MTLKLSDIERKKIRHALGLDNSDVAYRNRFATRPDSADGFIWEGLVERGLAFKEQVRGQSYTSYWVSRAGLIAAGISDFSNLEGDERGDIECILLRNDIQARNLRTLMDENEALKDKVAGLEEEIVLLRARSPRKYIMARKSEWVRLFREVYGYLHTCQSKHGTDWAGRNHAMNALLEALKFMEADDVAKEAIIAAMNETTARLRTEAGAANV